MWLIAPVVVSNVYIRIDFACPSTCPSFVVYVPQKNQTLFSSAMAERDPSDITIKKNANLIWHVIMQFSGSRVKMLLRYQIFATLTKRMFSLTGPTCVEDSHTTV